MRSTYLLPLLLLALTMGCKKPEVRTAGSILAGETGSGVRTVVFDPPLVDNDNDGSTLEVEIDPGRDGPIMLDWANLNYSNTSGYSSQLLYSQIESDVNLEFLVQAVVDTVWECAFWRANPSTHETAFFNRLSGYECQGTAVLHEQRQWNVPRGLSEGTLIDSQGTWESGQFQLLRDLTSSLLTESDTNYVITSQHFHELGFPSGSTFLPFRYYTANTWRYGYVRLKVSESNIVVYGFGVEDPEFMEE